MTENVYGKLPDTQRGRSRQLRGLYLTPARGSKATGSIVRQVEHYTGFDARTDTLGPE